MVFSLGHLLTRQKKKALMILWLINVINITKCYITRVLPANWRDATGRWEKVPRGNRRKCHILSGGRG